MSKPDPKRLANTLLDYQRVDCRYQHTSEELKLVSKLLDVLNDAQEDLSNDYGFEGTLDVFWADTIAGCVAFDSVYGGWVYLPTARGEKPEKESSDDKSELERLVISIYDKVRHGGVMHVGPIEKLIRDHFDGYAEMVKDLHETDAGGGDEEGGDL